MERLYDPIRRTTVVVAARGRAHLLDRHGRPLCGADHGRRRGGRYFEQVTLDAGPTCGWCALIDNPPKEDKDA